MVFSSPKCISCERNGAKVTKFKKSSKYSLHLPSIFSLLSRTPFLSLMDLAILEFLSRRTPYGLPEHLVGLPVNGISFMSEICPRLHFGHFHRVGCRFSLLSLVPSRGYFLPLLATTSRLGPRTRAADEATAALNSRHTISAVYSGSTGNKEDTLSAKSSSLLSARLPNFIQ